MFTSWPTPPQINQHVSGPGIVTTTVEIPQEEVPMEVHNWLMLRGWKMAQHNDESGCFLYFQPNPVSDASNGYEVRMFRWYEAMAYEMYLLMTIGGAE